MKIGWTIKPTTKSEAARPHSKIMEGERSEGVFRTAVKTIVLPRMDNTSSGTFIIQLAMVRVDGLFGILSSSESWSKTESFNRSKLALSILGNLAFRHTFAENSERVAMRSDFFWNCVRLVCRSYWEFSIDNPVCWVYNQFSRCTVLIVNLWRYKDVNFCMSKTNLVIKVLSFDFRVQFKFVFVKYALHKAWN